MPFIDKYLDSIARRVPATAEEVDPLPLPSRGQLNKIVKRRDPDTGVSKAYICMEDPGHGYQWAQIAVLM